MPARYRRITHEELENWPMPESVALGENPQATFERRKMAIQQYAAGAKLSSITKTTGVSRQQLHYLIKRCLAGGPDSRVMGFRALVPSIQISQPRWGQPRKLNEGQALAGALSALFNQYPNLMETMFNAIVHGQDPKSKRKKLPLTWAQIHNIFLDECAGLGIRAPHYPFCSASKGLRALKNWKKKLTLAAAMAIPDIEGQAALQQYALSPGQCYKVVECDGHSVDVNWTLSLPGLKGAGVIRYSVTRLWVIVLIEVVSSAVLGYSICLGRNYSASDVARAVRSSLVPWKPRALSFSSIGYKEGECLPSGYAPELTYICFEELHLDNASSHLGNLFLSSLENTVNAVPVFGPRASPNTRPNIEGLFNLLEEAGIHTADGTTGNSPKDPRRSRSSKYVMSYEELADLIDLLVCRYNAGISPGTTMSRLEVLKHSVQRETKIIRRIPLDERESILEHDVFEESEIGLDHGKVVVRWRNARYQSDSLQGKAGLVGKRVLVKANSQDVRYIDVSLLHDGTKLGALVIEKRWRGTPHTLWSAQQARRLMSDSSFLKGSADIPRALREHLERKETLNASQRRALARCVIEQTQNPSEVESPAASSDATEIVTDDDDELSALIGQLGTIYR